MPISFDSFLFENLTNKFNFLKGESEVTYRKLIKLFGLWPLSNNRYRDKCFISYYINLQRKASAGLRRIIRLQHEYQAYIEPSEVVE